MLKRILTDSFAVKENISYIEVKEFDGICDREALCVLTEISNITKAVALFMPVIILASADISEYPVIKNTYLTDSLSVITEEYIRKVYNRYYRLPNVIMETKRLLIREVTIDDVKDLYKIYSESSITAYMEGLYEEYDEEVRFTESYIENMYGFYDYGMWIVCAKESGNVIGRAGLSNREVDGAEYVELGYVIDVHFQRQGYAYEACRGIMQYAKTVMKKEELLICTDERNLPSINLAYKLGFEYYAESDCEGRNYIILKCNL